MCNVMGARAVVIATRTLVPITAFADLSVWRSDSFGNTYGYCN